MLLRDYQINCARLISKVLDEKGLALFMAEPRVGKTLTALEVCEIVGAVNVLFVTKKKAISSIESDFGQMMYSYNLTVTNYDQLHNFKAGYDVVIADEFHCLGKYPIPSLRAKLMRSICVGAKVIMLSGTPSPESFSQLYHPIWASGRGPWVAYKNFYAWAKDYVDLRLKYVYNRQINDYSHGKSEKINKDIEPYVIRFTQVEAGFETVTTDNVILVDTPKIVTESINLLKRNKIFTTSSGGTVLGDTAVKLMMKVHQLSSGTVKTEEGEYIAFSDFKARAIREQFKGKKIAIFYKYIAERTHLEKVFNGSIADTPEEFNATDHNKIYITQIQSGREGINLSAADCLVMYNIDFSALSYWQARERMQTKARIKDSSVYWIMSTAGIEQQIYNVVQNKKDYTLNHFKKGL